MMGAYGFGGFGSHMFPGMGLIGGWSVISMGFGFLVVVGLVVWLLVSKQGVVPGATGAYTGVQPPVQSPHLAIDTAEEIVRERFARGEIDRDEYDRTISALRSSR